MAIILSIHQSSTGKDSSLLTVHPPNCLEDVLSLPLADQDGTEAEETPVLLPE